MPTGRYTVARIQLIPLAAVLAGKAMRRKTPVVLPFASHAAKAGAHIGTMPYKVFQMLVKHPLTDAGLEKFLADWKKAQGGGQG